MNQRVFEAQWRAGHYARQRFTGKTSFIGDTCEHGILICDRSDGVGLAFWIDWEQLKACYEFIDVENDDAANDTIHRNSGAPIRISFQT